MIGLKGVSLGDKGEINQVRMNTPDFKVDNSNN